MPRPLFCAKMFVAPPAGGAMLAGVRIWRMFAAVFACVTTSTDAGNSTFPLT